MTALFGRIFMLLGMVILPIGLYVGMIGGNIRLEVRLLFIGGAFFLVGWLMAKQRESS